MEKNGEYNYTITNMLGEVVISGLFVDENYRIPIAHLLDGMYVISLRNGTEIKSLKLMKSK